MEAFKIVLYALCVLTSASCAILLFRGYQQRKMRFLMWSAICFACLTVNSVLLFIDLAIFPEGDLRLFRLSTALIGLLFLLYGFIWDAE